MNHTQLFSNEINISDKTIGHSQNVFVIAEAGVAHFGSLDKAFRLVDLAVEAKADAVKFQTFCTNTLISSRSEEWQNRLRPKELSEEDFQILSQYCEKKGIIFLSTAHDVPSLKIVDRLSVPAYKIGSGEVKNWGFIKSIAERMRPVILSTGMYSDDDIAAVIDIFKSVGNPDLMILHCVTNYPALPEQINLNIMKKIRANYKVIVGYSDHTEGFHIPLAAVAKGAAVIEKHITLEYNIPNAQDWKVSCGPENFDVFVKQLREVEASFGKQKKILTEKETDSMLWARKSIVAALPMKKGDVLKEEQIAIKRPGTGIMPSKIKEVLGKKLKVDLEKDDIIKWDDIEL